MSANIAEFHGPSSRPYEFYGVSPYTRIERWVVLTVISLTGLENGAGIFIFSPMQNSEEFTRNPRLVSGTERGPADPDQKMNAKPALCRHLCRL